MKKILVLILCLFTVFVVSSCEAEEVTNSQIQKSQEQVYFEEANQHLRYHNPGLQLYNYEGYSYNGEYIYLLSYRDYYNEYSYSYYVYFDYYGNRHCSHNSCEWHGYDFDDLYYDFYSYGDYLELNSPYDTDYDDSNNDYVEEDSSSSFLEDFSFDNIMKWFSFEGSFLDDLIDAIGSIFK